LNGAQFFNCAQIVDARNWQSAFRDDALGLFTRTVAFILAGDMAVAYFMAHAPRGFFPLLNGGELAIVYCFVFLYLWVAGGGEWSLNRLRGTSASALSPSRA
jgi:hypothetical protein